jgi:protein-S-isoprenylcysteine O-methyltransferase Ste14
MRIAPHKNAGWQPALREIRMSVEISNANAAALVPLILFWFGWVGTFFFKKAQPKAPEKVAKKDPVSRVGIGLQMVGFATVFTLQRRPLGPIVPMPSWMEWVVAALQVVIAGSCVWLSASAVRTLGKQWTYVARTIEGHELITQGPYHLVRNPIYLAMFGMMVAWGLSLTVWPALLGAMVIFLIGTFVRIRSEEKLLRATFGAQFEDYARRVPAFLPGLF